MHRSFWNLFCAWLPLALWLAVLALESTSLLSAANTGRVLHRLAVAFFGTVDAKQFEAVHGLLRKTGHFLGYGILALLLFRGVVKTFDRARQGLASLRWSASTVAILGTCFVAILDEWHQSMLPARTGRLHDVMLDIAGAMVCQTLVIAMTTLRGSPSNPQPSDE